MNNQDKQYVAALTADTLIGVGGNWCFILDELPNAREIISKLETIQEVKLIRADNGYVVLFPVNYIVEILNSVGMYNSEIQMTAQSRKQRQTASVQNTVRALLSGNSRYGKKKDGYYELDLALFSCNTSDKIMINSVSYPAFALNLMEFCNIFVKSKLNVYLNVGDEFRELKSFTDVNDLDMVYENAVITSNSNGLMFTIRIELEN